MKFISFQTEDVWIDAFHSNQDDALDPLFDSDVDIIPSAAKPFFASPLSTATALLHTLESDKRAARKYSTIYWNNIRIIFTNADDSIFYSAYIYPVGLSEEDIYEFTDKPLLLTSGTVRDVATAIEDVYEALYELDDDFDPPTPDKPDIKSEEDDGGEEGTLIATLTGGSKITQKIQYKDASVLADIGREGLYQTFEHPTRIEYYPPYHIIKLEIHSEA